MDLLLTTFQNHPHCAYILISDQLATNIKIKYRLMGEVQLLQISIIPNTANYIVVMNDALHVSYKGITNSDKLFSMFF